MALIKSGNFMGLPMNIQRGNPIPLDDTSVWYATGTTGAPADKVGKEKMETYAASGATAYVGQILTYVTADTAEAYMISNAAGTLIKLASTTASGDLASDVTKLQGQVATLIEKVGVDTAGSETGIYALIKAAKEAAEAAQTTADAKVASITAADSTITIGGTATAPTIKANIPEAAAYSIKKDDEAESGYAATYHLTKDGVNTGAAINIPKDMVVKSGEVVTDPDEKHVGTFLVLTLANATEDKIYINVADLIEYVTSGSQAGDMVVVHIDESTHKVTATITDGTVTKAKLTTDIQASLGKADTAIQSVELAAGAANGQVTLTVDGIAHDASVTGLKDAAFETKQNIANIAIGTEEDTADTNTVYGVRKALTESSSNLTTEINKKVDKITSLAGGKSGVYTDNGSAGMALTEVSAEAVGNTIAKRDENGRLTVAEPAAETDAATKKYVDDNKVTKTSELTNDSNFIINTADSPEENIKIAGTQIDIHAPTGSIGFVGTNISWDRAATIITGVNMPTKDYDAAPKKYVDDAVNTAVSSGVSVEEAGPGYVITSISKVDGKITATKGDVAVANVTGLSTALGEKLDKTTYNADKASLDDAIAGKQSEVGLTLTSKILATDAEKVTTINLKDNVVVTADGVAIKNLNAPADDADAATKKYVDDTITTATAGLTGAMHYVGTSTTDPATAGATVAGVTKFAKGDVVVYGTKEFVCESATGNTYVWRELGDEGSHAIKGAIKDSDIAADAAIAQSKIAGLVADLEAKLSKTEASTTYETKFNVINCGGAANL